MLYWPVIHIFKTAIRTNNKPVALFTARLLSLVKDCFQIKIKNFPPAWSKNDDGVIFATAFSTHKLYAAGKYITQWVRISKAGYGLDRNHPENWAAIQTDQHDGDYLMLHRDLLDVIGLKDEAPRCPEPINLTDDDFKIKEICLPDENF